MSIPNSIVAALALLSSSALANFVDKPGAERVVISEQKFGYFFSNLKWPAEASGQTIINVCWEGDDTLGRYQKETEWVRAAIADSWQKHSRIEFRGWGRCTTVNDGIRIAIVETGPRVLQFGTDLNGDVGGMELNFTLGQWDRSCVQSEAARELCVGSLAVHEFGHAIGFAHEQDRADTPAECARREGTGTEGELKELTPWDLKSVMNYCNPVNNNGGKLSQLDIQAVQQKYGVPRTRVAGDTGAGLGPAGAGP